jgi:hypothetical protein
MFMSMSSVKGLRNNLRKRMDSTINWAVVQCLYEGDVLSFDDMF